MRSDSQYVHGEGRSADRIPGGGFVGTLAADDIADLRRRGTYRTYGRGDGLFHELQATSHVVVIETGQVKVTRADASGYESLLAFHGPGDLIGEQAAIDGRPRSASILALSPVGAHAVSAQDFLSWLRERPEASLAVMRLLSGRLRDADRQRAEFGSLGVPGRISSRLVELAERFGEEVPGGIAISLPLSQEELAGWVGASREATVKALAVLRREGAVLTDRRALTVCDLDALRRRAGAF
jgi:CRP/FNR family cyclic AMP-dependent transcriptional regulator